MNLESHLITSESGLFVRNAWLQPGSAASDRLCIFLDAELYVDRIGAPEIVNDLVSKRDIPPLTCVFLSHLSAEARHYDYTCNEQYGEYIATTVVDWVRGQFPSLSQGGHVVCGLSLSGLASAFLALSYPDVFSAAISQSPSFWFNNEQFATCASQSSTEKCAYWISVGESETETEATHSPTGLRQCISQIASCTKAANVLHELGNRVHFNVFSGGHDIGCWRDELPSALEWVIRE